MGIKLQFGLDFYEEPITVTDPETGEESTEWVTKTRPMVYEADKAVKGQDYVHLLDSNGTVIASFEGISDFSGYELIEGEWSEPDPGLDPITMIELALAELAENQERSETEIQLALAELAEMKG